MNWVEDVVYDYYKWLRERTGIRMDETTGWTAISTPFLGAYNDPLEIYVRKVGDNIEMCDDGVTIASLTDSGININDSKKLKDKLNHILQKYGVTLENDELRVEASLDSFPLKKHALLCAMIEISAM